MTTRERFQAIVGGRPFDRLPIVEWAGWWDKTVDRWHKEGLPAAITDRYELCDHLGLDMYKQDWFGIRTPECPKPPAHGLGIVSDVAGYEQVVKYLYPENPVDEVRWRDWADSQTRGEAVLWFSVDGFFWFARTLLGIERHLYAFYDQRELLHRMNSDLADWMLQVIDSVCRICTPDFMTFAEDMSYNHGPMISKEFFDEFMLPYYQKVIPELDRLGIIPVIDSDGDVSVPAFWFEDAGIKGILPLERQAAVDISRLRADHPDMVFVGHFDKMTMNKGEARMRQEFERLLPTAAGGRFLVSCDHQTPPGVSYNDYQVYLSLFREYGEEAGRLSRECAASSD